MKLLLIADEVPPPPGGLAWGRYPAPAWVLWIVCAATVIGAAVFLVIRARRARRKRSAPPERR